MGKNDSKLFKEVCPNKFPVNCQQHSKYLCVCVRVCACAQAQELRV